MFLLAEADAATVDAVLINWHSFFFLLFALLACAFAVAVVVSSNVVHMAFFLTVSLGATPKTIAKMKSGSRIAPSRPSISWR